MKIYNKYLDQAVRTIDSVKPTSGFKKTKEFKKNLEIKKLEKQLGKKPTTQKFNKGGRVGLKRGGGKFPDFSGDGKTTMKDILMARGVIPKPKGKKKMMAKKSKSPMDKTVRKA